MADQITTSLAQAKVLVMKGQKGEKGDGLPEVSAADNGKILMVVDGRWQVVEAIPSGDEGEEVWFDDRNVYVQDYMAASDGYTAANRSTLSVISQYASTSIIDQDAPRPFLGQYNLEPAEENEVGEWTVTTLGKPPRMLKLDNVWNVRDCGGYSADGGKVAYGKLFRGSRLNNATTSDLALLAEVGIKLDLDIRDAGNAANGHIPNADYLNVPLTNAYAQMIQNEATAAANACIAAMNAIVANKPIYIHCASGADRTGCICAMLEAVLGMSDADIDRDFELTCFSDVEVLTGHARNGGSWTGFWSALPTNQGSAKLNVAKFLRDNGATTALLNSFRQAMIDGTPSDIDTETKSITNNLTGCTTSNNASSVVLNDSYSAVITPNTGYTLVTLTVTMGGVDITSTAVSGGTITIASVTGNVVITAFAEAQTSYTNLVRTSQAVDSTSVYNGIGYKNGYYLDSGDGHESANANDCMTGCIAYQISSTQPTDVLYVKGYTGTANASHTRMTLRNPSKARINNFNGFLSTNNVFDVELLGTGYYKLTPKSDVHHYGYGTVEYLQFSFNQADGSDIIITKNEPIE